MMRLSLRQGARLIVLVMVGASMFVGGIAMASQGAGLSGNFASLGPGQSGDTKPGKGCGDKNHYHERSDECKKQDCTATLDEQDEAFRHDQESERTSFEAQQAADLETFLHGQQTELSRWQSTHSPKSKSYKKDKKAYDADQSAARSAFERGQAQVASSFASAQAHAKTIHDDEHRQKHEDCDAL